MTLIKLSLPKNTSLKVWEIRKSGKFCNLNPISRHYDNTQTLELIAFKQSHLCHAISLQIMVKGKFSVFSLFCIVFYCVVGLVWNISLSLVRKSKKPLIMFESWVWFEFNWRMKCFNVWRAKFFYVSGKLLL